MVQLSWPLLARVVAAAVAALIISPAADSSTIPSYYNNNTSCACQGDNTVDADLIIVGATPGGIMAAVAAARDSNNTAKILILERTQYIGGLPANGLCATDIATFGATGGLFLEFVGRVRKHYVDVYGTHSQQVEDSRDGYHFEPKIAQNVLQGFLDEVAGDGNVEVRMKRQLDVEDKYAVVDGKSLKRIRVLNRDTGKQEWYGSKVSLSPPPPQTVL